MKAKTCNSRTVAGATRLMSLTLFALSLALPSLSVEAGWKEEEQVTFGGEDLNRFVIAEVGAHPRVPGLFALAGVSRDAAGSDRGTLLIYRETPSGLERKLLLKANDSKGFLSNFKSLAWVQDGSLLAFGNHAGGIRLGNWESEVEDPILMHAFLAHLRYDPEQQSWVVGNLSEFSDEQAIALREDPDGGVWMLSGKGEDGIVNLRKIEVGNGGEIRQTHEFCDTGVSGAADLYVGAENRLAVIGNADDQGILKVFGKGGTLVVSTQRYPNEFFNTLGGDGNGLYYVNSRHRKVGQTEKFLLRAFRLETYDSSHELNEHWEVKAASVGAHWGTGLEVTGEGDVVVSGVFEDQIILQGKRLTDGNATASEYEAFLAAFTSANGTLIEIQSIGKPGNDFSSGLSLLKHDVYVAGASTESVGVPLETHLLKLGELTKGELADGSGTGSVPVTPETTLRANLSVEENTREVARISRDGLAGGKVAYRISGGVDADLFEVDAETGILCFKEAQDYEAPAGKDRDNVYEVSVTATDGMESITHTETVTVLNKLESGDNPTYAIVDLSVGSSAAQYPVSYANELPEGWDGPAFKSDKILLKYVQPGTFMMGREGNALTGPVHKVTLTNSFYVGIYEVTGAQYEKVLGKDPSLHGGGRKPVESISWEEVRGGSWPEGEPATASFIGVLRARTTTAFDLPTEAQWEYAGRAGGVTTYSFGDDGEQLDAYAWHSGNSNSTTHEVGLKLPNRWGLYDMHGNVSEFCLDRFDVYSAKAQINPLGATGNPSSLARSFRRGSWSEDASGQKAASRFCGSPQWSDGNLGFRLVLNGETPGNLAPVITSSDGEEFVTVAKVENSQSMILDIEASDEDGDTIAYEISGGEDAKCFVVDSVTGVLTFKDLPDFEIPGDRNSDNAYLVEVSATDGDDTDWQVITVQVSDAFENVAPSSIIFETLNLNENPSSNSLLGFFLVTDANPEDVHTYSLVSGDGDEHNPLFKITDNLLRSSQLLDLAENSQFRIRVRVTDFEGLTHDEKITLVLTAGSPSEHSWDLATDHGNGWRSFGWFGNYFESQSKQNPNAPGTWIYHADLGWIYRVNSATNSIWFWQEGLGWLWTSDRTYPFLWRHDVADWLYLCKGEKGLSYFYGYAEKRWIHQDGRSK